MNTTFSSATTTSSIETFRSFFILLSNACTNFSGADAPDEIPIISEFNGKIKSIEVSEGDEVDEGQVVVIIE